ACSPDTWTGQPAARSNGTGPSTVFTVAPCSPQVTGTSASARASPDSAPRKSRQSRLRTGTESITNGGTPTAQRSNSLSQPNARSPKRAPRIAVPAGTRHGSAASPSPPGSASTPAPEPEPEPAPEST